MTQKYVPIACSFHDVLLDRATRRQPVEIVYRNVDGQERTTTSIIKDVFTEAGEEFMLLDNEIQIRLDFLVRVDEERLADNNYC
jgi:Rho-binding antiterminator